MKKKKYEYIPLKYDVIFKAFFARERNKKFLVELLNNYLKLEINNKNDVELLATELPAVSYNGKIPNLDLRVKLKNGEQINVEIQLRRKDFFLKRIYYYNTKLYSEQLKSGDDYGKLKKTISLTFTLYDVFTEETNSKYDTINYINNISLYHKESLTPFIDDVQLCFVELNKYKRLLAENKVKRDFWADLLLADTAEELVELSERGGIMAEAVRELKYFSEDDVARYWAEMYEKAERDRRAERSYDRRVAREEGHKEGRAEGRIEGREEGREEGRIEGHKEGHKEGLAQGEKRGKIIGLLMAGLDSEKIIELTNASEKEILDIKNSLN